MMDFWKFGRAVIVAAALSGGLVACGDDEESGAGASGPASTAPAGNAKKPTGKPIVIGNITDASLTATQAPVPGALDAAAGYINDELGGIKGRPVKVKHCDPKADPAATAACANDMVEAGALAVVGSSLILGACCIETLEKAQIPMSTIPLLPKEYSSKWQYALGGFNTTVPHAIGQWLVNEKKVKSVVLITLDLPTTESSTNILKKSIGSAAKLDVINYKFGLADLTAPINSALQKKPDFIVLSTSAGDEVKIITALRKAGYPIDQVSTGGEAVDEESFYKVVGEGAKGLYQTTSFDSFDNTSNEDVATYREVMDKAGKPARSFYAQWSFASMIELQRAASELTTIDGPSLQKFWAAAGPRPIFMGGETVALKDASTGNEGVRYLKENIVQWDGSKLNKITTVEGFPGN